MSGIDVGIDVGGLRRRLHSVAGARDFCKLFKQVE